MDYEKKYKETLAHAKQAYGTGAYDDATLEAIFPELRESEDERIRKWLIKTIHLISVDKDICADQETMDKAIAYLEKQKEQKDFRKLYEDIAKSEWFKKAYEGKSLGELVSSASWKDDEQKPISSCDIVPYIDDKIAALQDMWREEKVAFDWDDMHEMIEDVARHFAEWQKEQKPVEWSRQSIIDALTKWLTEKIAPLHKKSLDGTITEREEMFEAALLEMRSLVNSPDFQIGKDTSVEWSEEDEKIRRNLMSLLSNMRGDRITEETYQKYYPWVSALRPSWKPSEEQLEALEFVIKDYREDGCTATANYLQEIYEQIKKL